jgi:hypothetical protein
MNEQIFNDVLNDILEELKQSNQTLKTLQTTVKELHTTTTGFEQKLADQKVIAPPADTTAIRELTGKAMTEIAAIVEAQPKNVVKQWRLSFFPDNDRNGSFKHLINKFTLIILCAALILAAYSLALRYLEIKDQRESASAPNGLSLPPPSLPPPVTAPPANSKEHHAHRPASEKKSLDTLYKKYMRKNSDSLYEFQTPGQE